MAARTSKLWMVVVAMVRTFQGSSSARAAQAARARRAAAPAAFGSQTVSYGISSTLPPMR